jgi:hypothetical protein
VQALRIVVLVLRFSRLDFKTSTFGEAMFAEKVGQLSTFDAAHPRKPTSYVTLRIVTFFSDTL